MAGFDFLKTVDDFADRRLRGIYNPAMRNIGYYDDLPSLAKGSVYIYTGETAGSPREWQIKNLGVLVNATKHLVAKGLVPVWLTPEEKTVIISEAAATAPNTGELIQAASPVPAVPVAVAAGVAGLALLLILLRR